MPFAEVNLVPSVNVETTAADNPSGISESNFIRWRGAIPEKRGGCTYFVNPTSGPGINGTPTDLQPWLGLNGEKFLGIGTDKALYAYEVASGNLNPISPQYVDSNSAPPSFSTIAGSSTVTVNDPGIPTSGNGITVYDSVVFNTPISVGGLIIASTQAYQITRVVPPTSYEIIVPGVASATVTNGGVLPQFTTTANSSIITCTFPFEPNDLFFPGRQVTFSVPTNVGGLTIGPASYIVREVTPGTSFTFVDNQSASSAQTVTMNNNVVSARYWLGQGPTILGSGYGTNAYGQYGYGQGNAINPIYGNPYAADVWWLDNWGEKLLSCAQGGPLFEWSSIDGFQNSIIVNNAPIANTGMFVAMPQQQVVLWGTTYEGQIDPLQIRWSDVGDYTTWVPAVNNQAGGYRIPTGSKIVRGIQGQTQQFWFTDIDVYVAQYTGDPFVYGFNKIGSGCGLLAPRAVGAYGGSMFWMSQNQFFVVTAGGAPQPMPCSVWDFIFQNMKQGINPESGAPYSDNVVCGVNTMFNEVNWFFPSTNTPDGYPDAYVCYNVQYNEWDYGYMGRTAWYDQSALGPPIAANSQTAAGVQTGYVYQHETSYNLVNGGSDPFAINAWFKTGYFSLSNGQDLNFIDWVLPDAKFDTYALQDQIDGADLQFTFYVTDYTGQQPRVYGPYPFNKTTKFICPRFRGRYVAMKVESSDLNSFWRLGSIRYRFAPSGRR